MNKVKKGEITMTQEDKQLLLKDLCARLPYGIIINTGDGDLKLDRQHQCIGVLYPEDCSDEFNKRNNNASFYITISGCYYGEKIKPYLRPMSSMTEDEFLEYHTIKYNKVTDRHNYKRINVGKFRNVGIIPIKDYLDWLNKHYFDYRGLIEKGLALEATEGMYDIN